MNFLFIVLFLKLIVASLFYFLKYEEITILKRIAAFSKNTWSLFLINKEIILSGFSFFFCYFLK